MIYGSFMYNKPPETYLDIIKQKIPDTQLAKNNLTHDMVKNRGRR